MSSNAVKVRWEDLAREDVSPGYTRAGFRGERAQLVCSWVEPGGGAAEPHVHDFDQVMIVVEGSLLMELDGVEELVNAGQLLVIPAGVWHSALAVGEARTINFDLFAPPREDYAHLHPAEGSPGTE